MFALITLQLAKSGRRNESLVQIAPRFLSQVSMTALLNYAVVDAKHNSHSLLKLSELKSNVLLATEAFA